MMITLENMAEATAADAMADTLRMITSKTTEKLASKKTSRRLNAYSKSLENERNLFNDDRVSSTVDSPLPNKRISILILANTIGELRSQRQKLRKRLPSEVTCAKPKINLSRDRASTKLPLATVKSRPKKLRSHIMVARILNFRKRALSL